MPIAEDIVAWAADRPAWQRDSLRRLLETTELSEQDLNELTTLCKDGRATLPFDPVEVRHFQPGGGVGDVRIVEIAGVANANALQSDTPLRISSAGITLVYGPNGSGKSGYIRLLKQVCRARGNRPDVLPNVYVVGGEAPSVTFTYAVGDDVRHATWDHGAGVPEELAAISIFDHECASVYTDTQCAVAYLPFGLDLLPRLTDLCATVRYRLDAEIAGLRAHATALPQISPDTEAGQVLRQLDAENAKTDLDRVAVFSHDDVRRLDELGERLAEPDPARRANELEIRAQRVAEAAQELEDLLSGVSSAECARIRGLIENAARARHDVDAASAHAFGAGAIPGTGGDLWRALWRAAAAFSEDVARMGHPHPPSEGEACLLCQQTLSPDAADRLIRFDQFVNSELESRARMAEAELNDCVTEVGRLPAPAATIRYELELSDGVLGEDFVRTLEGAITRRSRLIAARTPDDINDATASGDDDDIARRMRDLVNVLRREAADLRGADDLTARAGLEAERASLMGRQTLVQSRAAIEQEIDRRRALAILAEARDATATTGITRRQSELVQQYVTTDLATRFNAKLEALGLDHVPIRVAGGPGLRGVAHTELTLEAPREGVFSPARVLSQGEHRSVSLAAFLAETSVQDSSSMIILDDPVSSLDHDRRDAVAGLISEVARSRPVVIFTHDLAFGLALQQHCEAGGVAVTPRRLVREMNRAGVVREDLPWHGMKTSARVGRLRHLLQSARAVHARGEFEEYERLAKEIYGFLREAWERGVEEVLLNGAIERFSPAVKTMSLRRVALVTEDHLARLNRGMTRTSRWLRGHDDPAAIDEPVPAPDEVSADIEELETWRRDLSAL